MEGVVLVDGPNVLLEGLKITDAGRVRIKSGLIALAKEILDSQNFNDWHLEIFCDCQKIRQSQEIVEYKKKIFYLIFCPKKDGGADSFLLKRARAINKNEIPQIIVTNDKRLRENILFAVGIEESSFIELVYVKDFMEKIKNGKKPSS